MSKPQSSTTEWGEQWNPDSFKKGPGIIAEGFIRQMRLHSVVSKSDIIRYTALVIEVKDAHVRLFDSYGAELTPNFKRNINCPNKLTHDQLASLVGVTSPTAQLTKLLEPAQLAKLHPKQPGFFEFWVDDSVIRASKLSLGDEIRFKTAGDSILLLHALQTSVTNFDKMEGGNVLNQVSKLTDRYTDKPEVLKQDLMEGVDESEWD